jgi:hypothetical protein
VPDFSDIHVVRCREKLGMKLVNATLPSKSIAIEHPVHPYREQRAKH